MQFENIILAPIIVNVCSIFSQALQVTGKISGKKIGLFFYGFHMSGMERSDARVNRTPDRLEKGRREQRLRKVG
ncbi:hypothetical protein NPIL_160401, partial [Nephila pilipes]